jgi:hypothetical protein
MQVLSPLTLFMFTDVTADCHVRLYNVSMSKILYYLLK